MLLAEAGFGPDNPLTFDLTYNTADTHKKIAVTVADLWRQHLGAVVNVLNVETKVHYSNLKAGDFQVARAGWAADYADAQNFLQAFETGNPYNYGKYSNPEFDALMDKAAVTVDAEERRELLKKAERIALEGYSTIPLFLFERTYLVAEKIKGFIPNVKDRYRSKYLTIETK